MPIWAIHGTSDPSVPYAGTQAMCQELGQLGSTVYKFDSMQNYGHNVWDVVGKSTEMAEWLFSQSN